MVFESCVGNALALSPASGHYLKYYNHISVFIYLHVRTIYMDWYPRSWPMSQSFCTPPDPSLQSENSCQGNGGLNLDRFYVHHTAEHIRTGCFMAVCPKIKEYCNNVFRGICKWMAAYCFSKWMAEPILKFYSMCDISHAPFLWRSQRRFKREVQNDHHGDGCTAPPAPWSWRWRDCTMHTSREWHQWSLRWHSIAAKCIGDFLYRLWTSDSPEKRSIELRAEVRWVRRPPKRTQRPLRSACLHTGTPWNLTVTRSSAAPYATMRHPTEAKHSVCTACLSSLIWYVVDLSATLVWPSGTVSGRLFFSWLRSTKSESFGMFFPVGLQTFHAVLLVMNFSLLFEIC